MKWSREQDQRGSARDGAKSNTVRDYSGSLLYQRPLPYQPPPPSNTINRTTIKIVSMDFLHFCYGDNAARAAIVPVETINKIGTQ
jgi:hypothetical protein